jgi:hypothetical protein
MRQGYRPLIEALQWCGKNRKVDVSRQIGGAMEPGIHTAVCKEYVSCGNYCDYIFESSDGLQHKERVWAAYGKRGPVLGSKWKFELHYAGDGNHHIEKGGEMYYLVDGVAGKVVTESSRISGLYAYVKEHNIKLRYLRMKWKKELTDANK